jgi:2-polyprenyl-3-methyl-5-hydroxy-6-metoxy-1,4-benzoquinol methylase
MDENEVKAFYNTFLKSTMVKYRLYGNARIERASERIIAHIENKTKILDIGCGIGIATEKMALKANDGYVWAIDLSDKNIWYANKTIKRKNIDFLECDTINEFKRLKEYISEKVDIVTLVDVIEHIPEEERIQLFKNIDKLTSSSGKIILTYPSPEYQKYLQSSKPEGLQIIDNIIELETLIAEASIAGFKLYHYSLETIWRKNDYVHVIFQKDSEDNGVEEISNLTKSLIISSILRKVYMRLVIPLRRRKYITKVFKS